MHCLMVTLVSEHVWQVTLLNKGLGNSRNILGRHLLCLTDRSLSLVKLNQDERAYTYEFSVRCFLFFSSSLFLILSALFLTCFLCCSPCVSACEYQALWSLWLLLLHGGWAFLMHRWGRPVDADRRHKHCRQHVCCYPPVSVFVHDMHICTKCLQKSYAIQFIFTAVFSAADFAKFIPNVSGLWCNTVLCFITALQLLQKYHHISNFYPSRTHSLFFLSSSSCLIWWWSLEVLIFCF